MSCFSRAEIFSCIGLRMMVTLLMKSAAEEVLTLSMLSHRLRSMVAWSWTRSSRPGSVLVESLMSWSCVTCAA